LSLRLVDDSVKPLLQGDGDVRHSRRKWERSPLDANLTSIARLSLCAPGHGGTRRDEGGQRRND